MGRTATLAAAAFVIMPAVFMSSVISPSPIAAFPIAAPAATAYTPGGADAPEYYYGQWSLADLWASGADGHGITIAEIDTGVDADQPALSGRVVSGVDFGSLGGDGRVDRDKDSYGHGTSMASIMVGRPGLLGIEGIAPGALVQPVAIPLVGTTDAAENDQLPDAIRWAADHGAKIISMSLGGARRQSQDKSACPADEQAAILHALAKGVLVFAASGNAGRQGSPVEEPGVCIGVVSVGATDEAGDVAGFSSRHPYLTMTAPGVNVPSIGPGGTAYVGDGTSQATAIASAATALVWSKYPRMSASQVLGRVLATLDNEHLIRDPAYGYGTINPYRAVVDTVPRDAPDPVFALAAPFLRQAAAVPALSVTTPISTAPRPPGRYEVGIAPEKIQGRLVPALVLAGAGLLLLLILLVVGRRSRRRRRLWPDSSAAAEIAPEPQG